MASITSDALSVDSGPSRCNEITDAGSGRREVDATSFVQFKLSSQTNYDLWQEQMMRLLRSHDLQGFIDGTVKIPMENDLEAKYMEWKRSDTLVKKWIRDTLSEEGIRIVEGLDTANDIWNKLMTTYSITAPPTASTTADDTDMAEYLPLCRAIVNGKWEVAQQLLSNWADESVFSAKLDRHGYTAIHHAIETSESSEFVGYLLEHIDSVSLPTMVDSLVGCNPLHLAAMNGHTEAARMLVEKNPHLLFTLNGQSNLPIHTSVANSHRATSLYLLQACKQHIGLSEQHGYPNPFEDNGAWLLTALIDEGFVDEAYDLIKDYPNMAAACDGIEAPLAALGAKFDLYYSGTKYNFYKRFVYSRINVSVENNNPSNTDNVQDIENQYQSKDKVVNKCTLFSSFFHNAVVAIYLKLWNFSLLNVLQLKHLHEAKVKHNKTLMLLRSICEELGKTNRQWDVDGVYSAVVEAAKNNTPEVIEEVIGYFPKALWSYEDGHFLIQLAVIHRSEKVYNLLVNEMSFNKTLHKGVVDVNKNNLLHLAAGLAPIHKLNVVSGAALQMQRELQWFWEVERLVQQKKKEARNESKETPMMVFRREHKELRKEGEEWMKKTADSYTITAALIITIVFAAAITVPGGTDGNTGKAVYAKRHTFLIFAISDAISLFTSTTSLLLSLSILTARYRDEDFLYRLPKRLILGLAMLFLSVTSMMVAFSATLYIMFGDEKAWILIPIAFLTCLPITSFVTLQFPLLLELIYSTYGRGIFGKQKRS